jgi:ferrous iron transport protein B
MAAPAGAVIWMTSNIYIGDASIAGHMFNFLNPLGLWLGLNGIILVAYIVAIPANEIVIPTILMLTLTLGRNIAGAQTGVMLELDSAQVYTVLTQVGGWTMLTAVNLMLFSLMHNPCSTTILTIWNETKNRKWTLIAAVLPVAIGIVVTFSTSTIARLLGLA